MTKKIEIDSITAAGMAGGMLSHFSTFTTSSNGPTRLHLMSGDIPVQSPGEGDVIPMDNNTTLVTWKNNRITVSWNGQTVSLSTYAAPALTNGIATWFYGKNSNNGKWFIGTVGLTGSGADLELDDVNIIQGKTYGISNLRFQTPTSFTY